jgi:hypothetical protein
MVTSIQNISSLQSLTGPFNTGDAAIVDGYYTAGDLGGGSFFFDASPPGCATVSMTSRKILSVSGATNTSPIQIITSSAHEYVPGEMVVIGEVGGNAAANGVWTITVTSSTSFTLNGSSGTGNYTPNTGHSFTSIIATSAPHDLVSGQQVTIAGVIGTSSVNGTWRATVVTPTTFSIAVPWNGVYGGGGFIGDGGLSIPSSGASGIWRRIYSGDQTKMSWFGLQLADTSAAITAAIASGSGTIVFPPGVYLLANNVAFPTTTAVDFAAGAVLSPIEAFASFAGQIRATQMQQIVSGGQIWAVSQTGTAGSPQISVVSRAGPWTYALQVQITTAGSASTAKFRYSLDGGATWITDQQAAPTFPIRGTSLTLSFPAGPYNSGTNYEWILNQTASSPSGGPRITANPLALPELASFSDYTLQVQIVTAGPLRTAQFRYRTNGGPWSSAITTPSSPYSIPTLNIRLAFGSDSNYLRDAIYGWTTSGPAQLAPTSVTSFTPVWWGAKGDGATDSTAAIQAAVNAVQGTNPGSYTIFFPSGAGPYVVSAEITFAGDLSHAIRFLGQANSELGGVSLAWDGPSNVDGSQSQVLLTLSTASGFRFEHMLFSGQLPTNPTPGVTGPQYLVWIRENSYPPGTGSTEHGIFQDCTFQGSYGPGSACVAIGDGTGGDIAQIVWRECVFQGTYGPLASGSITGATNTSPIQIATSADHGLSTGSAVLITSVGGNPAANGDWYITVTGPTTFTLNGSAGNGAYTSGGTFASAATTEYGLKFSNQAGNNLGFRMSDCQWQIFRRANVKCVSSVASLIIDNPNISNIATGPPVSGLIADWYVGPYIELTILGGRSEGSGRIVYSYPLIDILGSCTIQGHNWNGASVDFSFDPIGEASQAAEDVAIYWTGSLRLIGNRIWNQRGDATHPPNIMVGADPGPTGVVSGFGFDGAIFSQGNHYYNCTFLPFYDAPGGNLLAEWQDYAKTGESSVLSRFDIGGQDGALIRFPSYEGENLRVGSSSLCRIQA